MKAAEARPTPAGILEQLRLDEGERLYVYPDSLGWWTIGVGRLVDRRKGGGISAAESAMLLSNDLSRIEAVLDQRLPWWRQLDRARQGVLMNMAFQLGADGLAGFTTTLNLIQVGRYADASRNMLQSLWATQTPERAKRLAEQMRTGNWQ